MTWNNAVISKLLAVLLSLGSAACCRGKPTPTTPSPIQVERRNCLTEQPPALPQVADGEIVDGGSAGCPAEFAGCMRPMAALALRRALAELLDYSRDAWIKCGDAAESETQ